MSLCFETSFSSINKYGEELCGDKVEIVKKGSETIIVLSDGLGSGVKANILASLTSKIVSTMLQEGADVEDVIETVASTLPVCSERKIAYSTFSFLHLNKDGNAHIVEYDNPDLVILRNGKMLKLPSVERIVNNKKIKETRIKLEPDDICIMFSDGVVHAGVGKLLNLGWQHENVVEYLEKSFDKNSTAFSLQNLLLSACYNLYDKCPGDDTTVAVCRVRTPNVAYVMVGPPVDKQDDEKLVNDLLNFEGTKIVCGGTTSQIVSRISGRELKTMLDYISPDVPPVGKINGIDIVSEGVITLGKALEIMKSYETNIIGRDNALNYKSDGAMQIAQTLLSKCTGAKFIVGRALNPAHQNPNMPIDLSIKLRLVEEIAECLSRFGKDVEIRYY